jgi:superfamily I DNA and/or RNA helicase
MQDFNGYVPISALQDLGKGVVLWECEKNGDSYEVLHIPQNEECNKKVLGRIWQNTVKPLRNMDIVGIQKVVDGGELENGDIFIVYENSEETSDTNPLDIMKNIAVGLNKLKKEKKHELFVISPVSIKNKLRFVGLFEIFKKLDLLDKEYLSPNVNEWLKNPETGKPNFQDDIYSLVKCFEEHLKKVGNENVEEVLRKGLAAKRTDRFSKHSELIALLDAICLRYRDILNVRIKDDIPSQEFLEILDEMNSFCELSIEPNVGKEGQIAVRFYTDHWQGIFFVDDNDNHVFIPVQHCKPRFDSKTDPNWFVADFSFSLDNESSFDCSNFFAEKFNSINQLAGLNRTKKETVSKWQTMPKKEREFIEENMFKLDYENVEFKDTNAIFSLSGNLNNKTWETMKKHKSEKTLLYIKSLEESIPVGKIGDFDQKRKNLVIKDVVCIEAEIIKEDGTKDGTLVEDIHQKISQFKKQVEACQKFSKGDVANPVLCSILANSDSASIPPCNVLSESDYDEFKNEVFNRNLQTDETQLEAVLEAINYKPIYLIQGPPGTGKTTVIVECIRQIIKREPNSKILVTSQSNLAVDNVLEKIVEIDHVEKHNLKFMRLASESEDRDMNVTDSVKPHTYEEKLKKWARKTIEKHRAYMTGEFSVQEKNKVLVEFYKSVQAIAVADKTEKFGKIKENINKHHNNYIKRLFENAKTTENVKEIFENELGKEYLKLKDIGEEWIAFLRNVTNKDKKRQSKLNNGSEEIDFLTAMMMDISIIGATCIHIVSSKYAKINFNFDYVIMDESSKASPAEALVPINMGRNIILIGDHKQLPPIVTREDAVKQKVKEELEDNGLDIEKEYGVSLFEILITDFEKDEDKQKYIKMLDIQYRMPRQVGTLISKFFYDGKLNNPSLEAISDFDEKHDHGLTLKKETSIVFLSTSKREKPNDNGNKHARQNDCNMRYIKEILKKLNSLYADNSRKENPFTIGIIAGYRGQVELLKENINVEHYNNFVKIDEHDKKNSLIEINTVDKFQGAERDIIIYDIVRSDGSNTNIGFLDDDRRINVAFSRVKRLLIVVGDSDYIIDRAKPNPGDSGIFKKFKLKAIARHLREEGFIFNMLEEIF